MILGRRWCRAGLGRSPMPRLRQSRSQPRRGRNAQVAGQRKLETAAHAQPVDRRDEPAFSTAAISLLAQGNPVVVHPALTTRAPTQAAFCAASAIRE